MRALMAGLFLSISLFCSGNKIDELTTPRDVLQFVKKVIGRNDQFREKTADSGSVDFSFIKIDLNGDGLTDILINGEHLYAIVDQGGHNHFEEKPIGDWNMGCRLLSIDSTAKLPILVVQKNNDYDNQLGKNIIFTPDTLVYLYGGFIEYNPFPVQLDVSEIKISTSLCFGTCPVFELTINKKRQAVYNAKKFNGLAGIYETSLSQTTFTGLVGLLSYINPGSLKTSYQVGSTDHQTIELELHYNGLTRKIRDYGLEGTFGLQQLYRLLFRLRETEAWE